MSEMKFVDPNRISFFDESVLRKSMKFNSASTSNTKFHRNLSSNFGYVTCKQTGCQDPPITRSFHGLGANNAQQNHGA